MFTDAPVSNSAHDPAQAEVGLLQRSMFPFACAEFVYHAQRLSVPMVLEERTIVYSVDADKALPVAQVTVIHSPLVSISATLIVWSACTQFAVDPESHTKTVMV